MFAGVEWLHISGIIPANGPGAARLSLDAIAAARFAGVKVSFDGNFRASMWARWCDNPRPILLEHVAAADMLVGNHRDISLLLDKKYPGDTPNARRDACNAAFTYFDNLQLIASTARRVVDADTHLLSARVDQRDSYFETPTVTVPQIVDRIGTGDAFGDGVLAGLSEGCEVASEQGLALAALKHAPVGDQSKTTIVNLNLYSGQSSDVRR